MALTLLLGGARSGKSALAVELGRRHGDEVVFVATAPATDGDMASRIARHRAERPSNWATFEEPLDLLGVLRDLETRPERPMVIVDCLTLWVSNMMWHDLADEDIERRCVEAATAAAGHPSAVVAVSNEVGLGVHPETPAGRRFRDVLGRVNQAWAAAADTSLILVAGRAVVLDDPWDHLPATAPNGTRP